MTSTLEHIQQPQADAPPQAPVDPHAGRRRRVRSGSGLPWEALLVVLVAGVAFAVREINIGGAYDVFIDEITYRQLGVNLATGQGLTLYGEPFTLHPPTVFLVLAAAARALGLSGPVVGDVLALRTVGAAVGAAVVVLGYVLLRRVGARWPVALAAAALLTIDPFQISFDSRVLLEPYAQLFTLGTLLAVVGLRSTRSRGGTVLLVLVAGLLGALTLTSKETFGLVLGLTLVLCLLLGLVPRRRLAAVIGIAVAGYLASAAVVSTIYGWSTWWGTRLDGLARLVGTEQSTGFNAPTSQVSLVSRLVNDLDQLIVTYGLLLLGGIGALVLLKRALWRAEPRWRDRALAERPIELLVPVWALSACAYLGYATVAGSIEEQMYYIPLTPCLLTLMLWGRGWADWGGRRTGAWVSLVLVLAPVAFGSLVWAQVHTGDHDSYRQLMAWEPDNVPDGSRIAVTEDNAQFLITDATVGQWSTRREIDEQDVDYVLVQTKLVREGYGLARPRFLAYLEREATPVFEASAGDGDRLVVFDVRALTGGS